MQDRRGDKILEALESALKDNPYLQELPLDEVARQLVLGGYVETKPSPELVEEAMTIVVAEEQAFGPDVPLEDQEA